MDDLLTVGQVLKAKRVTLGLSQRALGAKAGLAVSYVTRLEAGALQPSLASFARLSRALDLSHLEISFVMGVAAASAPPTP